MIRSGMSRLRLPKSKFGSVGSFSFMIFQAFCITFTVQNCLGLPTLLHSVSLGKAEGVAKGA